MNQNIQNNNDYLNKLEKFLWMFKNPTLSTRCCCGCTLRVGIIILSVVGIIFSIIQIFSILLPLGIANAVGYSYLLGSTSNRSAKSAFIAYMLTAVCLILGFIADLIRLYYLKDLLQLMDGRYEISDDKFEAYLFQTIVVMIFLYLLSLYFQWIIYCYAKLLAKGDWNTINGGPEIGSSEMTQTPIAIVVGQALTFPTEGSVSDSPRQEIPQNQNSINDNDNNNVISFEGMRTISNKK